MKKTLFICLLFSATFGLDNYTAPKTWVINDTITAPRFNLNWDSLETSDSRKNDSIDLKWIRFDDITSGDSTFTRAQAGTLVVNDSASIKRLHVVDSIVAIKGIRGAVNVRGDSLISDKGARITNNLTADSLIVTKINTGLGGFEVGQDLTIADAVTFATVNTGQGANELYDMNQNVLTTSAPSFATVNTGQGANELYDMNQNVLTTSDVIFDSVAITKQTTFGSENSASQYIALISNINTGANANGLLVHTEGTGVNTNSFLITHGASNDTSIIIKGTGKAEFQDSLSVKGFAVFNPSATTSKGFCVDNLTSAFTATSNSGVFTITNNAAGTTSPLLLVHQESATTNDTAAMIKTTKTSSNTQTFRVNYNGDVIAAGDVSTVALTDYSGTSTFVGWISFTADKHLKYKKIGKTVKVWFHIDGISNSTSTSVTLPFANKLGFIVRVSLGVTTDGGITQSGGSCSLVDNGSTLVFNRLGNAAWTNTGVKLVHGYIEYETN